MTRSGIIEFEDIFNRRVTVRYKNLWEKSVYWFQLLYLRKVRKCIKNIWYRPSPPEPTQQEKSFLTHPKIGHYEKN